MFNNVLDLFNGLGIFDNIKHFLFTQHSQRDINLYNLSLLLCGFLGSMVLVLIIQLIIRGVEMILSTIVIPVVSSRMKVVKVKRNIWSTYRNELSIMGINSIIQFLILASSVFYISRYSMSVLKVSFIDLLLVIGIILPIIISKHMRNKQLIKGGEKSV